MARIQVFLCTNEQKTCKFEMIRYVESDYGPCYIVVNSKTMEACEHDKEA